MYLVLERMDSWDGLRIVYGNEAAPAHDSCDGGGVEVAVVGYPYDRRRIAWLKAEGIHRSYMESGMALLEDLDGSYAVIILDRNTKRCFAIIDPYKIFTLFHAPIEGGRIILSDSIAEIARHLPDIRVDRTAALEFFNLGFMLGPRTLLEGVSTFESGRVYTIDEEITISEEPYWSFTGEEGASSPNELIDAFNTHVANGLRLSERISMPLTGGLDSRTALSACMGERDRLHCYTHGQKSSDDVRISRRIARKFGIRYDYYEIGTDIIENIPTIAMSMSLSCNGLLNTVTSAHFLSSYERESEHGELFFSGIGGELLRSYYVPSGSGRLDTLEKYAGAIRRKIQFGADSGIYQDVGAEEAMEILDRSVQAELSRYGTEDRQVLAESFYLENRIGNFLSMSMRLLGRYFKIFNPFLERDMLRIIPRLRAADKSGGELQKRIILHNAPELARILMDRARIIDSSDSAALIDHLLQRPFVLAKIYANKLSGRRLFNFSFTDYDTWLKSHHRDFVMETLDYDRMQLGTFFERDGIEDLKRRFLETRSNLLGFATNIMSAEIFLRRLQEVREGVDRT